MRTALALLIGGLSLAGCTTTPMVVNCDPFRQEYAGAVPRSDTFAEIQADVLPSAKARPTDARIEADKATAYADLIGSTLERGEALTDGGVLALSGGGQWGAFGAGYLEQLQTDGTLPRFRMVTGVSTGALQALFVGASQAPSGKTGEPPVNFLELLAKEYTIEDEDEVVHRGGYVGAAFRGSVAKLDPLRLKIETALCSGAPANPQTAKDCPLIRALGAPGAPVVMLGFVEAASGEMQAVNVSAISRAALKGEMTVKDAQQCITGGALASVAMPFFYQQVQVTSRKPGKSGQTESKAKPKAETLTYYDGGVRQSMFLWESVKALAIASAAKSSDTATATVTEAAALAFTRPVYMIRNGPTTARVSEESNAELNALDTAERGYSLIVNQSEVTAIEAIRLRDDKPEMRLATADGYDQKFTDPSDKAAIDKVCAKKNNRAMFDPDFMKCLQAFGRYKAVGGNERLHGWIILTPQ